MSHYTDEPRFTIEQIDLLQRLRGSGMTKQEILHALDTLERLEREHVQKFGPRQSYAGGTRGGDGGGVNSHNSSNSAAPSSTAPTSSSSASVATQTVFHSGTPSSPSPIGYDTSPPPTITVPMGVVVPAAQNGRDGIPVSNGKLSPTQYSVPARAFGFEPADEDLDIDDRVEELMRLLK